MLRLKTILQSSNILLILCILFIIISFIICNIKIDSKYDINDTSIEGILIDSSIDGNKYSFIVKGNIFDEEINLMRNNNYIKNEFYFPFI